MSSPQRFKARLGRPKVVAGLGTLTPLLLLIAYTTQPILWTPRVTQGPAGDPARLEAHVRTLVDLGPRDARHPAALAATEDWIEAQFQATSRRVSRQALVVGGRTHFNLVARFGPTTGPLVVVGAHFDACDGLPGADDNASGVAALLELARLLARHPPSGPVELVAWNLEEPPHFRTEEMGSRVHARALRASAAPVRLVVCLEMLGTYDDRPGSQHFPIPGLGLIYPSQGNFLVVVGGYGDGWRVRHLKGALRAATSLPIRSINAPAGVTGIDFSDHASYWKEGLPAVMLTDTAFFRNPRYHTEADTPDQLDYVRMAEVVRALHSAVESLARP